MLINNLNAADEHHVILGNAEDVCILCAHEYAVKNKKTLSQADRALRGKFERQKMLRLPLNGIRATICLDHIHKVAKAHPLVTLDEIATEAE